MKTLSEFIERYFKNVTVKVYQKVKGSAKINGTPADWVKIDEPQYHNFTEDDIDEIDPVDIANIEIYLKGRAKL